MNKGIKVRLYPNKEQKNLIDKTLGCSRLIYNKGLAMRKEAYENGEKVGFTQTSSMLTELKKEETFLTEVDSTALQQSLRDLDRAYKNFFQKRSKYPQFKSKKENFQSYRTINQNGKIRFEDNKIKLPKIGFIKTRKSLDIENSTIKNATIERTPTGKYFAVVNIEFDPTPLPTSIKKIGIDMGVKTFYTTDKGVKVENPKYLKESLKKLQKEQRKLSRKKKGSNNRNKQRIRVAKAYEKIANQRLDFLQKESTKLINENQVICIEDIKVRDLLIADDIKTKKHNINRAQLDASWHKFFSMLEYKSNWYGRTLIKVSYPSSETCSSCGTVNSKLKDLLIRNWRCPTCGKSHDRDINAAINILNIGLRIAKLNTLHRRAYGNSII